MLACGYVISDEYTHALVHIHTKHFILAQIYNHAKGALSLLTSGTYVGPAVNIVILLKQVKYLLGSHKIIQLHDVENTRACLMEAVHIIPLMKKFIIFPI